MALATTGHGFLLGRTNTADKITTLSRTTAGAGLQVRTKSESSAPFVVNGTGKVTHLNADTVDGLDSSKLITKPYVVTATISTPAPSFEITAPVPVGTYLVSYSVAVVSSPDADLVNLRCTVYDNSPGATIVKTADNYLRSSGAHEMAVSGSGLARKVTASGLVKLSCVAGASFTTTSASEPIQFVLSPVNGAIASSPH